MCYENWTRKTGGFVLIIWALVVLAVTWVSCRGESMPTLAEWGGFITAAILAGAGVLAVMGGKSIGTDAVNKVKSVNGTVTSEPTVTKNP